MNSGDKKMSRPPAKVGDPVSAIDTPALVIDLPAFERNLEKMASFAKGANVRLRPHAKTHKCAMIARRQLALGAVGVCCQKVSEAEDMVAAGVSDVLVTNEIVGETKVSRLAALAREANISVLADHPDMVSAYSTAAERFGTTLGVLVELYSGSIRAGVHSAEAALELARQIDQAPGLRFAGLQAYRGPAQHIRSFDERLRASQEWCESVRAARDLLQQNGLLCESVTGAGTGTYAFEVQGGVFTEIQVGSYAFMDADYGLNLDEEERYVSDFENSLFILSTVMSSNTPEFAVVDAGAKAGNVDQAMPSVWERPGLTYVGAADEHGAIEISPSADPVALGERLWLVPGHCDPTINLYDWIVGVREGRVETVWSVSARGALL